MSREVTNNKLVISAAGCGKTTRLIKEVENILSTAYDARILIVTYTENNQEVLRKKLNNSKLFNIDVHGWFEFLLKNGCKPYKFGDLNYKVAGLNFVKNGKSSLRYAEDGKPMYIKNDKGEFVVDKKGRKIQAEWREEGNFDKHYFDKNNKIYSDKLAKFTFKCNESTKPRNANGHIIKHSKGKIVKRLEKIYTHILIDEAQDLAGFDLSIIAELLKSDIRLFMVGDPRQVVFTTTQCQAMHKSYEGKIDNFIEQKVNTRTKEVCRVIKDELISSQRNCKAICDFSSTLYPNYGMVLSSKEVGDIEHVGIFAVKESDIVNYYAKYNPTTLRLKNSKKDQNEYNFGKSKGMEFDRVLIFPTEDMLKYSKNKLTADKFKDKTKAQFYVAITRARYSVAIVFDSFEDNIDYAQGLHRWIP